MENLSAVPKNENAAETEQVFSGGVVETGVYNATIVDAFIKKNTNQYKNDAGQYVPSQSYGLLLNVRLETGSFVEQVLTIAKHTGETFSVYNGVERPTVGFSQVESLANLLAGKHLHDLTFAPREVEQYDFDAKAKKTVQVSAAIELLGKEIKVAIKKEISDGVKPDGKGGWVQTGQPKEKNTFDKFFDAATGLTSLERKAGATETKYLNDFMEINAGKEFDRRKKKTATTSGNTAEATVPGADPVAEPQSQPVPPGTPTQQGSGDEAIPF